MSLLSFSLDVQQLMHLEDFSLNGGLFFGTYSLLGQMRSIPSLPLLTLRCLHYVIWFALVIFVIKKWTKHVHSLFLFLYFFVLIETRLSKLRRGSNSCKCSNCNSCSSAMHNCNVGILIMLLLVVLWMLLTLKEWWDSHQPVCWPWKCMKNVWNTLIQWIQRHPHL